VKIEAGERKLGREVELKGAYALCKLAKMFP